MYLKICKKYNVQPEPEIKADGGLAPDCKRIEAEDEHLKLFCEAIPWISCFAAPYLPACKLPGAGPQAAGLFPPSGGLFSSSGGEIQFERARKGGLFIRNATTLRQIREF